MTDAEKKTIETRLKKYSEIQAKIHAIQKVVDDFKNGNFSLRTLMDYWAVIKGEDLQDRAILKEFAKILEAHIDALTAEANNI